MESFKLWEQCASKMMSSMVEQTMKQSDVFQRHVAENFELFFTPWQPLNHHKPDEAPSTDQNGSGETPSSAEPPPKPEEAEAQAAAPAAAESPPPANNGSTPPSNGKTEPVWTFRGYQLEAGNFTNAMVHFFRAEHQRALTWRQRLDTTTNWAVLTTAATLSLAWDPQVIIVSTLLVTLFLLIEARRYRYYELWSYRVRLMETDFFAAMLVPPFRPASDWAESLAANLLRPEYSISKWEAFGRRFRRNYVWIYSILWIAWLLSVWLHPTPATNWGEFLSRAAIGPLPAWLVMLIGLLFNGGLIITGLMTRHLKDATGEILPPDEDVTFTSTPPLQTPETEYSARGAAWFRPSRQRQPMLAYIITDQAQTVAGGILNEIGRGVTSMTGTGMYTEKNHAVLMCALTTTEIERLKGVIKKTDPHAFVMISTAQQVFGDGFNSLHSDNGHSPQGRAVNSTQRRNH